MRKNLFEILADKNTLNDDFTRLRQWFFNVHIFESNDYGNHQYYSLYDCVNLFFFDFWKQKGRYTDASDFLNTLDIKAISQNITRDNFLTYLEIVYNFWYIVHLHNSAPVPINIMKTGDYEQVKPALDDFLSAYGQITICDDKNEKVFIVDADPVVEAAIMHVKKEAAFDIVRYNHYSVQGDIRQKRAILCAMSNDYEAKEPKLKQIHRGFASDISELLNNLDIRHNNSNPVCGKSQYHPYVDKMSDLELENWYDELYQMLLLATLEIQQVERNQKVKRLLNRVRQRENPNGKNEI